MAVSHEIEVPPTDSETTLIDFEANLEDQSWALWKEQVINEELTPQSLKDPNVVINTIDTLRHSRILGLWLQLQRPCILCGPPGSGKSMTLTAVLRANPQCEMVTLNFSSTAGTDLLFKAFEQYCKVSRTSAGYVLHPTMQGKKLVIFCDEINLPAEDMYGTQSIITFMRQLMEKGGYWHPVDRNWIRLQDVQVVGACNPPTDAGRVVLNPRFLNHCPLVLVDFPGRESLLEIYGSFVGGLLKLTPSIRSMADSLTLAMVDVYQRSQRHFTTDMQAHYVYSPRELSRWTRAMYRALADLDTPDAYTPEDIVRLWAHEALRLFSDRLVNLEERIWTWQTVADVANTHFGGVDLEKALAQPIYYTDYLSADKNYESVSKEEMREYILQRIAVFNEEELDVPLVVYNELVDHILRIDRVLRQPLGHLLMVGAAGAGKTVFSRFVSWMLGMKTFQLKVHKDYSAEDFDLDLRQVLVRSGVHGEKITFIFDESNILDTAFLERMNALLASGEVPGLFEDADYQQLIRDLREAVRGEALLIESEEELYQWFTKNVQNNLHIVFTMNPAGGDFSGRAATSPALFNRCVINWWGTWPKAALLQVAAEFTQSLELGIGVPPQLRDQLETDEEGVERSLVFRSVAETIVDFHYLVEKVMEYLAKQMATSTFVTPRHFLDLIRHFKNLFEEKRNELEEQQKHLSVGLAALKETEEEVAKRKVELDEKEKMINSEQKNADVKLGEIMESEKDAKISKREAESVEAEVKVEIEAISKRSAKVEAELADAKPALERAMKSVSAIQKKQLDVIKAMKSPPAKVKMTLEAVLLLIGPSKLGVKKVTDWKQCQRALGNSNFIPSILKFDTDDVSEKTRKRLVDKYLANPDFNYKAVFKASQACGPLVQWVISQVNFARLLQTVEPMRLEITKLRNSLDAKQKQAKQLRATVDKLEAALKSYKEEYQRMVQRITELKNEMKIVKATMSRATKLLLDLSDEKERWSLATKSFEKQLSTLVADCLLSAGFLTYIGYYNITYRRILVSKWKEILVRNGLPFNETMSLSAYLSTPAERIQWKENRLPDDELCVENAIILKRFNRYPLVIDPSAQATNFLMTEHKSRKIQRTSFLDASFLKSLETALRFGNSLLIEDVESMDPILNPVLNRETQNVGGRTLIRLASKELDFSELFCMYLVTRDPSSVFSPDLCSRVTFVNFSVTPSSLRSQCLAKVLRLEAPAVDEKRTEQLRLQGEFKFQLRELEDKLLAALQQIEGNILDDSAIMETLENLKMKAKVIQEKAAESQMVLEQIEEESRFYTPFARACTKLYFSLESLATVHFLYQFDLKSFLAIVDEVLNSESLPELAALSSKCDRHLRLVPLMKALHRLTYVRTKRSLLVADHTSFAMRVAQSFVECHPDADVQLNEEYMHYLLRGVGYKDGDAVDAHLATRLELSTLGSALLGNLLQLTGFAELRHDLERNVDDWAAYRSGDADAPIPGDWGADGGGDEDEKSTYARCLEKLVIEKALRPDQMIRSAKQLVEAVFDWRLEAFDDNADSLLTIVSQQLDADTPLLMASRPGNDPSSKIDQLAAGHWQAAAKRKYETFAMGSPEAFAKADAAIVKATRSGHWVLLKNVHLCTNWLQSLEKKLHRIKKAPDFRLFLTMEMVDKMPVTMLRKSLIIVCEPPLGIKASLQRTFQSLGTARVEQLPSERSRLYVLLAWLHAVVLERLRFEPIGWSKAFEFSETDRYCAMDAMDEWITRLAQGRANVDPDSIPWDALHKMLVQYVYGGRIDNAFDTYRLTSFVENLFSAEAYNAKFALSSRCVECKDSEPPETGRLGYVYPTTAAGRKIDREMLARVVRVADDKLQVVFLQKYLVHSKARVLLNAGDNWLPVAEFRAQPFRMQPAVTMPDTTALADIKAWVSAMDDTVASNPAMIGLPPRAEMIILATRASKMCADVNKLQDVESTAMEELTLMLSTDSEDSAHTLAAWMKTLAASADKWMSALPATVSPMTETKAAIRNPLFRFVRREYGIALKVLRAMRSQLSDLLQFIAGDLKATNDLRKVVACLARDEIPEFWKQYTVAKMPVTYWIQDFVRRSEQVSRIADSGYVDDPYSSTLWLGGMFSPAGFVAATRQFVAQKKKWSMEAMTVALEVNEDAAAENCFRFEGLTLYGAGWHPVDKCLVLTQKTATPLGVSRFKWLNEVADDGEHSGRAPHKTFIFVPVYLNTSFKQLLFTVRVPVLSSLPPETWVQRSVSLSVWTQ